MISSIVVFAVGATLDLALTGSPYQHGFNIHTVGIILMVAGAVGFGLSGAAALLGSGGFRSRRTMVDDGHGTVVQREDRYR